MGVLPTKATCEWSCRTQAATLGFWWQTSIFDPNTLTSCPPPTCTKEIPAEYGALVAGSFVVSPECQSTFSSTTQSSLLSRYSRPHHVGKKHISAGFSHAWFNLGGDVFIFKASSCNIHYGIRHTYGLSRSGRLRSTDWQPATLIDLRMGSISIQINWMRA